MKNKRYSGYIIGGIIVLLGIYVMVTYNGLVSKEEKVKLQWNEVQNAYQRRNDLVPNLVNVVKAGAEYEQTTLQQVTEARAKAGSINISGDVSADQYQQQTAVQDQLASATNRLLIAVEKYPDIKGTKAFSDLQVQLVGTERRIKIARKDFNDAIATYNSSVKSFPTKLVAGMLGFKPKEGFTADAGAEKSVEIKF
ncbi:LemA family protein [Ferruginibacter sp. HRS2-29]|uniref:LemA family protein n=1 Tax=Ferruginibacter sp. HRS2-29 TaxID=2487334 RepID=UPI0020CD29DD|nr:LemA family protein [Ferruginibacter sp. HRS2-29]MCP9751911.1 LemA family protein [Ferruginibacter sp. HRS2-29]